MTFARVLLKAIGNGGNRSCLQYQNMHSWGLTLLRVVHEPWILKRYWIVVERLTRGIKACRVRCVHIVVCIHETTQIYNHPQHPPFSPINFETWDCRMLRQDSTRGNYQCHQALSHNVPTQVASPCWNEN